MELLDQIAFTLLPGIGAGRCRELLAANPCLNPFALTPTEIRLLFANTPEAAQAILNRSTYAKAEQLLRDAEQRGVRILFCTDPAFPQRLNRISGGDAPVLLYVAGTANLNAERTLSIVGTRKATPYGRDMTARIVKGVKPFGATIISGLAYGIDTAAHTAAVDCELPTVAVLGHGLDRIYPPENSHLAHRIVDQGGALLSEYPIGTPINPRHFPARNRIIAAMGDATIVSEAAAKGGALITTSMAIALGREVFAIPGRLTDSTSEGTNNLIADGKAHMLRTAADLCAPLRWPAIDPTTPATQQTALPIGLNAEQQQLFDRLRQQDSTPLDELARAMGQPVSKVSATIFTLEMEGLVRSLPGKCYALINK